MSEKTFYLSIRDKITMGRRLRYARRMKKLSIEELAAQVKMSPESILRMEEGDFELFDDFPTVFH